jgi:hypothetical protein
MVGWYKSNRWQKKEFNWLIQMKKR